MLRNYEPEVTRFLRAHLRHASVFYDVGAANGQFSRLALRTMNKGIVIAFEPNPAAVPALERLAVQVVPVAVGAKDGDTTLELRPGAYARLAGTVARTAFQTPASQTISVPMRALDSLDLPHPDVVKIDVEGSELDVLEGGRRKLESTLALAVECHSVPLLRDVLAFVVECGYFPVSVTRGGDYIGPPAVLASRRR
jgi:FkbM family methyltransferase